MYIVRICIEKFFTPGVLKVWGALLIQSTPRGGALKEGAVKEGAVLEEIWYPYFNEILLTYLAKL